jgi:hypothetical protein
MELKEVDVKIRWEDCTMSIFCPVCGEQVYLDSQNDPTICDCGSKYYLRTMVCKVKDEK